MCRLIITYISKFITNSKYDWQYTFTQKRFIYIYIYIYIYIHTSYMVFMNVGNDLGRLKAFCDI